jgi:hypothetical protein
VFLPLNFSNVVKRLVGDFESVWDSVFIYAGLEEQISTKDILDLFFKIKDFVPAINVSKEVEKGLGASCR